MESFQNKKLLEMSTLLGSRLFKRSRVNGSPFYKQDAIYQPNNSLINDLSDLEEVAGQLSKGIRRLVHNDNASLINHALIDEVEDDGKKFCRVRLICLKNHIVTKMLLVDEGEYGSRLDIRMRYIEMEKGWDMKMTEFTESSIRLPLNLNIDGSICRKTKDDFLVLKIPFNLQKMTNTIPIKTKYMSIVKEN